MKFRHLLVSKSAWNESQVANAWPRYHPARAAWIGDAFFKFEVATHLIERDDLSSVGSLTSLTSFIVSAQNLSSLFDLLKLDELMPWALSARQKAEGLEQLVGLVLLLLNANEAPLKLNLDEKQVDALTLQITQALVFKAERVQSVPEELVASLLELVSLLVAA